MYTVNDIINARGVYLILGVQVGVFSRWEAFILITHFNELNITVYSMLSAKNVFVLTESRLRADALSRNWTWHNTQTDVNQAMKLINWLILLYFSIS